MNSVLSRSIGSANSLRILWLALGLAVLAACHSSDRTAGLLPPTPQPITVNGLVSDGPVSGGTIYGFTASTVIGALEAADGAADRGAALGGAQPFVLVPRTGADADSYSMTVDAALADQVVFLLFDNAGAEDQGFGDTPPNMESVAALGAAGSTQTINMSTHTTVIARLVLAELDPDGDGTPIDDAAVRSAIQAAQANVLATLGENDNGDDLFGGESPIDTDDSDLLHAASSVLGEHLRIISAFEAVDLDSALHALAADVSDGALDGAIGPNFDLGLAGLAAALDSFLSSDDTDDFDVFAVGPCSTSAVTLRRACAVDRLDDRLEGSAFCADISDEDDRSECLDEIAEELEDTADECDEIFEARLDVCDALADNAYEPPFGAAFAASFVDPREIGNTVAPNPYFPLVPGNQWVYEATFLDEGELVTETVTVTVLDHIKFINGISCVVVNDVVVSDAGAMEDTNDWFAQDLNGNVWYCGEVSRDFEVFDGDDPEEFELVETAGSWKHGRDGAEAGILIPADPIVGEVIRQEVLYGEAEDVIEIVSITGTENVGVAACAGDCLVTRDFTPLDPEANEHKYYAPGIGMILEIDLESGDRLELIEHNPG